MSDKSKIEWTDTTWNPVRGCSVISPGCKNCYAQEIAKRFSGPGLAFEGYATKERGWTGKVDPITEKLTEPLRWKKPRRVFVNSMSDLFHEELSFEAIAAVFGVMAASPDHTFQVLTKRPERAVKFFEWVEALQAGDRPETAVPCSPRYALAGLASRAVEHPGHSLFLSLGMLGGPDVGREKWPLHNVHIGVSVENQQTADERIPLLLQIPSAVRFLSCEPLLGPVEIDRAGWLRPYYNTCQQDDSPMLAQMARSAVRRFGQQTFVDWVIVGGESGQNARPMHPDWALSLRDQCLDAGVPFFFKQWGEWLEFGPSPYYRRDDRGRVMFDGKWREVMVFDGAQYARLGKKASGRMLQGIEWSQFPEVRL